MNRLNQLILGQFFINLNIYQFTNLNCTKNLINSLIFQSTNSIWLFEAWPTWHLAKVILWFCSTHSGPDGQNCRDAGTWSFTAVIMACWLLVFYKLPRDHFLTFIYSNWFHKLTFDGVTLFMLLEREVKQIKLTYSV